MKRCKDCKWFCTKGVWSESFPKTGYGLCRAKVPSAGEAEIDGLARNNWGMWPVIGEGDWCGKFRRQRRMSKWWKFGRPK